MDIEFAGQIRLVYVSTAHHDLNEAELDEILEGSRKRNRESGITGLLVYGSEHFFQVLEGARDQVNSTLERIKNDQRHDNIFVLLHEALESRLFEDWSMAFKRFDESELKDNPSMEAVLNRKNSSAEMINKLLQSFRMRLD